MRPLREEGSASDRRLARDAAICARIEPLAPSEDRQRRVRAAVRRAEGWRPAVALRRLAVAAVLLAFALPPAAYALGAPLRAALARLLPRRSGELPRPATPPAKSVGPTEFGRSVPAAPPPAASVAPRVEAVPAAGEVARGPAAVPPPTPPVRRRPAGPGGARERFLADAEVALRRDRDYLRAEVLVDSYLLRPGGRREQALWIGMRAAEAAGHAARAQAFARRYLTDYPAGRHAAFARGLLPRP